MELNPALDWAPTAERPRFDPAGHRLTGSRCTACGATSWPARAICQQCGRAATEIAQFGPAGILISFTTVWVPRPGLEVPYTLGQVVVEGGPAVFGHVRGLPADARTPFRVTLRIAADDVVPPFWFEPA